MAHHLKGAAGNLRLEGLWHGFHLLEAVFAVLQLTRGLDVMMPPDLIADEGRSEPRTEELSRLVRRSPKHVPGMSRVWISVARYADRGAYPTAASRCASPDAHARWPPAARTRPSYSSALRRAPEAKRARLHTWPREFDPPPPLSRSYRTASQCPHAPPRLHKTTWRATPVQVEIIERRVDLLKAWSNSQLSAAGPAGGTEANPATPAEL